MRKLLSLLFLTCFLGGWTTTDTNVTVGRSASGNKTVTADKGSGATNPKLRWNNGSTFWDFTNDGTNFFELMGLTKTQTMTGKTVDGDDNTVQDLPETALKTNLTNASKFFTRNSSGVPESTAKAVPTGAVVGTTDSQTLTTKILTGNTAVNLISGSGTMTLNTSGTITLPNATDTLVGKNTTDTLTLKTLTSPQVNSGVLLTPNIDDYMDINEESAPSTPSAGKVRVYAKTDKKIYKKDSTGAESEVGAASGGSGEINVITNPNNADAGWAASGSGVTVGTTTTGSDLPLATSSISSAIKITPVSGTSDYAYIRWTMPTALKNTKLKVEWYQHFLTGYASGDLKLEVHTNTASNYSGTDATLPLSTDVSSVSGIPAADAKFSSRFDSNASDYYEMRIKRTAGTTALVIASVVVGPGIQPQSAVIQKPQSITLTPSAGFGTTSAQATTYTRFGSWMLVQGKFLAGTSAATNLSLTLPTGYSIDYSVMPTTSQTALVGKYYELIANATPQAFTGGGSSNGPLFVDGSDTTSVYFAYRATVNTFKKDTGSQLLAASASTIGYEFWVPISEWNGSGTVNLAQNDVEFVSNSSSTDAADTSSFVYGQTGSVGHLGVTALTAPRKKRVRFINPFQAGDKVSVEIDLGGNGRWVEVGQTVLSNNDGISQFTIQNTSYYGVGLVQVNSTDWDVSFGTYGVANGSSFGAAGKAWNSADYASSRWRVKKVTAGQAVGFGTVSQFSNGLVPYDHSTLDNASATRLGLKPYVHGTSYNGSVAPTVTLSGGGGSLSSVPLAEFIPYQLQDGTWHCKLTMQISVSSTSRTTANIAVNGLTFASVGGNGQAVAGWEDSGSTAKYAVAKSNSGTFEIAHAATNSTAYYIMGDVKLASKPTWAY